MNKLEMVGDINDKFNQIDKILIPRIFGIDADPPFYKKLKEIKSKLNKDDMYKSFENFKNLRNSIHSLYDGQKAGIILPAILPFKLDYDVKVRKNKIEDILKLQVVYDEFIDLYTRLKEYLNNYT